jgi:hypothetical protein
MKPEWQTKWQEHPNPTCNCFITSISFGSRLGTSYYPVEGGFKVDRHRKNAKLYASESEIRGVLLRQLLAQTRKDERLIRGALESVD